jgi:hypothetical protein
MSGGRRQKETERTQRTEEATEAAENLVKWDQCTKIHHQA